MTGFIINAVVGVFLGAYLVHLGFVFSTPQYWIIMTCAWVMMINSTINTPSR